LDNEELLRFFLVKSMDKSWTAKKLTMMVNDFLGSNLTAKQYIEAYKNGCKQCNIANRQERESIEHITTDMDNFSSTLTSFRTINLFALADNFHQKMFMVSAKGLRVSTQRLLHTLDDLLLTSKELLKVKESEKKILNIPFKVTLTKPPKQRSGFRFTIPVDLAKRIDAEMGDTLEIQINAVLKSPEVENAEN